MYQHCPLLLLQSLHESSVSSHSLKIQCFSLSLLPAWHTWNWTVFLLGSLLLNLFPFWRSVLLFVVSAPQLCGCVCSSPNAKPLGGASESGFHLQGLCDTVMAQSWQEECRLFLNSTFSTSGECISRLLFWLQGEIWNPSSIISTKLLHYRGFWTSLEVRRMTSRSWSCKGRGLCADPALGRERKEKKKKDKILTSMISFVWRNNVCFIFWNSE